MTVVAYALIFLFTVLAFYWVARSGRAPRNRKKNAKPTRTKARTPERVKMEQDLQVRLQRLKKRTDHVAQAVKSDPRRAANAVRSMMNDKK